jgi:hypothetical protein
VVAVLVDKVELEVMVKLALVVQVDLQILLDHL